MKIAIFHNLPSGGAKRAHYEWMKRLSEKHVFDLYAYGSTSEKYLDIRPFMRKTYIYGNKLPMYTGMNLIKKIILLSRLFKCTKLMARDIDNGNYDLVFATHCIYIQSPLVMRYLKTPTVYYCHDTFRRVYEPMPWRTESIVSFIKDLALRTTDIVLKRFDIKNIHSALKVLTNSEYSREAILKAYNIEAEVSFPGVDVNQFKPNSNIEKEDEVISVGRVNPLKGHDFVIRSLALLDEKVRPKLKIISDSADLSYKKVLVKLARVLNVSCTIVEAHEIEMAGIYNRAKLTLFAPVREPLGLVALESMACGVPVIGVREGGISETVIHEKTGLLTKREPCDFAKAVEYMLTQDETRKRMGEAGVSYVKEKWTWEISTGNLEKRLKENSLAFRSQARPWNGA